MNMGSSNLPRVALIAGPTASGKSALALELAANRNGTIINADSAQVYRDLRVLSARPSPADEAKAPHRLYGYRDGAEPCSAGDWAADAKRAIEESISAGRLPILVGGTGLYLRTLLEGIAPVPDIDDEIRAVVRALAVQDAYAALLREDAEAAARLRPTDKTRVARALEVKRSTGHSLQYWQRRREGGIAGAICLMPVILLPPRDWLHARCDARFQAMMNDEGIDEVRRLTARKLDAKLPVMRAIGVSEISAMIDERMTPEEAMAAGQAATRQYAKRQYTWFRHQPPLRWPRHEGIPVDLKSLDKALSGLPP
jgi:tRNA dimethylallyltransferase